MAAISSQGKIVAYNLAQNGYVKWDIGLILQWGKTGTAETIVLFPISFNSLYAIAKSNTANNNSTIEWRGTSCYEATNKQFKNYSWNYNSYWLAIGK